MSDDLDPQAVELLAATLRADSADLDAYHRVLSETIAGLLPAGMVEVDRERSMSDRLAGRPGRATAIRLELGDRTLELQAVKGRLVATAAQEVKGVVISRKEISVADWARQLAGYLGAVAAQNAEARVVLGQLLGEAGAGGGGSGVPGGLQPGNLPPGNVPPGDLPSGNVPPGDAPSGAGGPAEVGSGE